MTDEPMIDVLNDALQSYDQKWQTLISGTNDKTFFEGMRPTAVGWKVEDRAQYDKVCAELHELSGNIVETWMNGRWIGKFILRDGELQNGIKIIKVMQRRPGSEDATGLDHVDFFGVDVGRADEVLADEPSLKWTRESNDIIEGYDWISLWFDGTEAKLKSDTVLDIVVAELNQLDDQIKGTGE